jgi:hypothetical protein
MVDEMEVLMQGKLRTAWIILAILFAVLSLAMIEFNLNPLLQAQEAYDFSKLGTRENPTRDLEEITNALMFIKENRVKTYSNVWIHRTTVTTQLPVEIGSPYMAKNGIDITENWDFVNEEGLVEKILIIQKDQGDNVLQVVAYGDGIGGNLSSLENDDLHTTEINVFEPVHFVGGAGVVKVFNEMNTSQYKDIYAWVEQTLYGDVLFLSGVTPAQTHTLYNTWLESYITTTGIFLKNGEIAHLSFTDYKLDQEIFSDPANQDIVLFEVIERNEDIADYHASVLEKIKQIGNQ